MPGCATDLLPIRRLSILAADGSSASSDLVYCHSESRSVAPSRCARCSFGGLEADLAGRLVVACRRSGLPLASAVTARPWAALAAGLALGRPVSCLRVDVRLRLASAALRQAGSTHGLPVVDGGGALVGLLPRTQATLAMVSAEPEAAVARHVSAAAPCVWEGRTLEAVFQAMAGRRAREVLVVDDARRVVGTLRDLEAIRFAAHVSRTGERPPHERAV